MFGRKKNQTPAQEQKARVGFACRICRCCGDETKIFVHWTLMAVFLIISLCALFTWNVGYIVHVMITNGPILVLTVLVHELGSVAVGRCFSEKPTAIVLWALGGYSFIGGTRTRKESLCVLFAGPLTHIPQFLIWLAISFVDAPPGANHLALYAGGGGGTDYWGHIIHNLCAEAMTLNIGMFILNLFVPAYPLNGGTLFANCLSKGSRSADEVAKILCYSTWFCSLVLIIYGAVIWISFSSLGLPGAPFFIFVPLYLSLTTYFSLWKMQARGAAADHPLFKEQPYPSSGGGSAPTAKASAPATKQQEVPPVAAGEPKANEFSGGAGLAQGMPDQVTLGVSPAAEENPFAGYSGADSNMA